MGKTNWRRVVLCGIVAGSIFSFMGVALDFLALGQTAYMQAILAGFGRGPWPTVWGFVLDVVGGIWTMWLCASIRPLYRSGPGTAVIAGVAAWIFSSVVVIQFALLRLIQLSVGELALPLALYLPIRVLASLVGASQLTAGEEPARS